MESTAIMVENLSNDTTIEMLELMFSGHGEIWKSYIIYKMIYNEN